MNKRWINEGLVLRIISHMPRETVDCVKFGDRLDLGFGQQYERVASHRSAGVMGSFPCPRSSVECEAGCVGRVEDM